MSFTCRAQYQAVIGDVASTLLGELGCETGAIERMVVALTSVEVPGADPQAGLDIRFEGLGGSCEVTITAGNREILRRSLDP